MKKLLSVTIVLLMVSTVAMAADFQPTLLKLTADSQLQYDFDGTDLTIPVDVAGTNAGVVFSVFTKDMADEIGAVHNGYLGWHYVNKMDTCVYYSTLQSFGPGQNEMIWNGTDNDGNQVAAGDYTYYMWAFDNVGSKVKMANFTYTGKFQEIDTDGVPLQNPIFYRSTWKWAVGNDPMDDTLRETTSLSMASGWGARGEQLDPSDFDMMYVTGLNDDAGLGSIVKWKFVAGGDAELQTDFGAEGYADSFSRNTGGTIGVLTDGQYLYTGDENHVSSSEPDAQFYIYDFDGTLIEEVDLTEWWSDQPSYEADAQMNGGPNHGYVRHGQVYLNCHCSCLTHAVDPVRYLDTAEQEDFTLWVNGNGDYTGDHNFEDTASLKWICMDYNVGPYKYTIVADDKNFSMFNAYDAGAVSFGMFAPDGTGLGYYAYAGETAGWKRSTKIIDSDTPFDGLYPCNRQAGGNHYDGWEDLGDETDGIYFIGHDVISGIITDVVDVADEAPAAFAVDQNAPNPFNPTTTINFNLADAGNISVEVFNVAGQKIDTLVDGYMDAGRHSVTWDASAFSAGVYFYTVKSGDYSKTMKMTLLK